MTKRILNSYEQFLHILFNNMFTQWETRMDTMLIKSTAVTAYIDDIITDIHSRLHQGISCMKTNNVLWSNTDNQNLCTLVPIVNLHQSSHKLCSWPVP